MAGGTCVYVPLRLASDAAAEGGQAWKLDFEELRAAFTPRTRIVLINTPQNPTGKMLSAAELESLAAILRDFPRVVAVSDEVGGWRHTGSFAAPGHLELAALCTCAAGLSMNDDARRCTRT